MQSYLNLFIHNMYSIHLFLCHNKFIHNFQGHISQNCVYPLHMDTDKLYGHFLCVQGFCTCRIVCRLYSRKKEVYVTTKQSKETAFITLTMYHISSYPGSLGLQNCIELDDSSL